jgi:hypothetical protein
MNCDMHLTDEKLKGYTYKFFTNVFSEWIFIDIKRPYFNFGGWAFMSQEELDKHYVDDIGLLCDKCKLLLCNKCTVPKINIHMIKMMGVCEGGCDMI